MKPAAWVSSWWIGLAVWLVTAAHEHAAPSAETASPGASKLKYEAPQHLTGTLYAAGHNDPKVLFHFKRVATRSGSTLKVQRDFTYPDGRLAARERVVYEGDALVSYALEELQIGAAGSARLQRTPENPAKGRIEFTYTPEPGGRARTRTEDLAENTLIADMVGPFLTAHWEALARGDKVKCRYLVVPRRETVGFTFVKDSEAKWHGRDVLLIRMEPSSKWVATLVAPLFFTLEQAPPHRVLQYAGRTTPKVQISGKWKDLDAVTVFDWDSAH